VRLTFSRPAPPTVSSLTARWRASSVRTAKLASQEWIKAKVPARFHKIGDEIAKFGTVGIINIFVNSAVVNLLWLTPWLHGSQVKAKAIATVVAATSAYFMNRHWTYRNRPKSSLRREYTLFFAFNLVGLLIEVGAVSVAKYWLHRTDLLVLNIFSLIGIGLGTLFRFWAYRTHVFKLAPVGLAAPAASSATPSRASSQAASSPGSLAAPSRMPSPAPSPVPSSASSATPRPVALPSSTRLPVAARAAGRRKPVRGTPAPVPATPPSSRS
jgi:putative flippase GtrA